MTRLKSLSKSYNDSIRLVEHEDGSLGVVKYAPMTMVGMFANAGGKRLIRGRVLPIKRAS